MFKFSDQLPNVEEACFKFPEQSFLTAQQASTHPPRILMLYGSLRERSYSKLLTLEAARLLEVMGAEVRVFDPLGFRNPMHHLIHIRRLWSCGNWQLGRREWCGVRQSVTVR